MNGGIYDVIIVGGGPAGLSAALVLGRACKKVLVLDAGTPRNMYAKKSYGFLTRDNIKPDDFRKACHNELAYYPDVQIRRGFATHIDKVAGIFKVHLDFGDSFLAKKLLLATGLFDVLPEIKGIEELFGKAVFTCPYCDGWEFRGKKLAVLAKGRKAFELARSLTSWTDNIIICSNGPVAISQSERLALEKNDIRIIEDPIKEITVKNHSLHAIVFNEERFLKRDAIFLNSASRPQSPLALQLGCEFKENGGIIVGKYGETNVPGVFVAGNALKNFHLAIIAASEGTKAAMGINKALTREQFASRANLQTKFTKEGSPITNIDTEYKTTMLH